VDGERGGRAPSAPLRALAGPRGWSPSAQRPRAQWSAPNLGPSLGPSRYEGRGCGGGVPPRGGAVSNPSPAAERPPQRPRQGVEREAAAAGNGGGRQRIGLRCASFEPREPGIERERERVVKELERAPSRSDAEPGTTEGAGAAGAEEASAGTRPSSGPTAASGFEGGGCAPPPTGTPLPFPRSSPKGRRERRGRPPFDSKPTSLGRRALAKEDACARCSKQERDPKQNDRHRVAGTPSLLRGLSRSPGEGGRQPATRADRAEGREERRWGEWVLLPLSSIIPFFLERGPCPGGPPKAGRSDERAGAGNGSCSPGDPGMLKRKVCCGFFFFFPFGRLN